MTTPTGAPDEPLADPTTDAGTTTSRVARTEAMIGGATWWAIHLGATYWLAPRGCTWGTVAPVHVLSVVLLTLMARTTVVSLRLVRANADAAPGTARARDRFVGAVGLGMTPFWAAVVLFQWYPVLLLDPCA
ncbi:MAG: hypothetical protein JJT89_12370 [Nitriliruptoraceae bacterium]|nr:hypothetical protein [Nitriliruptoraceae bacterium]